MNFLFVQLYHEILTLLVIATPPIAALSEHYGERKWPLLLGQVCLAASQAMLMEVPTYWLMVIARVIQGISSSVVWVVGLALLYDISNLVIYLLLITLVL